MVFSLIEFGGQRLGSVNGGGVPTGALHDDFFIQKGKKSRWRSGNVMATMFLNFWKSRSKKKTPFPPADHCFPVSGGEGRCGSSWLWRLLIPGNVLSRAVSNDSK